MFVSFFDRLDHLFGDTPSKDPESDPLIGSSLLNRDNDRIEQG